jgi:hypothetical protein
VLAQTDHGNARVLVAKVDEDLSAADVGLGCLLGELDAAREGTSSALVESLAGRGECATLEDTNDHSIYLLVTWRSAETSSRRFGLHFESSAHN